MLVILARRKSKTLLAWPIRCAPAASLQAVHPEDSNDVNRSGLGSLHRKPDYTVRRDSVIARFLDVINDQHFYRPLPGLQL
jgi:hypothetical protein